MVWDPTHITPKAWDSVATFYGELEARNTDFRPMRKLAAHIAGQKYASSIAAATSGTALLIARPGALDWVRDALRVDVALAGSIRFTRPEKRAVRPTAFECESENAVATLERVLRNARWIAL